MTELTFLLELLLNHKLPKVTKDLIAGRIKDVEGQFRLDVMVSRLPAAQQSMFADPNVKPTQAASTMAILARNPDLAPVPVAVIAQTPATTKALQDRQESIALAMSGKIEKGRTSPRKF